MSILNFRTMSDLLDRAKFALRSGITFEGERDLYKALGYKRDLAVADYRGRFERGGVAGRVVDAYPKATWRGGAELCEDEDPEIETEFEAAWEDLSKRLQIWPTLCRADILAGLGRYSVLLIGAPGEMETELPKLSGPEDVLYLSPYCEDEMTVQAIDTDTQSERFGQPTFYQLSRRSVLQVGAVNRRVHWTRVIHVADGVLDDKLVGEPRLRRVWNDLDNLDKCVGSGSEAFWLRVHQGYFFKIDPTAKIEQGQIDDMKEQAEEFAHNLRRTMAMRGAEVSALGSDVSNFGNQVTSLMTLISGATGIPRRILEGSERGELASTQDKENWNVRVMDRRTDFAEPWIVRPLVDRLIDHGALPTPVDYEVKWPAMEEMTETEKGAVAVQWAGLNKAAGGVVVTPAEIRDHVLRLEPLTDEQIAETEVPVDPPPVAPGDPNAPPTDPQNMPPSNEDQRVASSGRPKGRTRAGGRSDESRIVVHGGSRAS
jgi:uncharacterized protein